MNTPSRFRKFHFANKGILGEEKHIELTQKVDHMLKGIKKMHEIL